MPQPFPNIFSGLNEGFDAGMQMGLMRQQKQQMQQEMQMRQAYLQKAQEQEQAQQDEKKADFLLRIQADPNTSDADSIAAHNALIPLAKKHYGMDMQPIDSWSPEFNKVAKKIYNIYSSDEYPPGDKVKLMMGVYNEAKQATQSKFKPQFDEMMKQTQEQGQNQNLQQGISVDRFARGLPTDTNPDVANYLQTERERLLAGAGAKGADYSAKVAVEEIKNQNKPDKLPYTIGKREKITGRDGKAYEGTFKGLDANNEPQWGEITKISEESKSGPYAEATYEEKLRNEFNRLPDTVNFGKIKDAYGNMQAAKEEESATGNHMAADQARIDSFNLMINPRMGVRNWAYAKSRENQSFINRIIGIADKVQNGGASLSPEDRKTIDSLAQKFYQAHGKNYNEQVKRYRGIAQKHKVDPDSVATEEKFGSSPDNSGNQRTAVRTGVHNGKKVIQYSDGSIEYAQ